jgi:hypothetical protein
MASGDVWKAILHLKWGEVECRPGFHLVEGSGGGGADPGADVAASVVATLGAAVWNGFSSALSFQAVEVVDAQPGTRPTVTYSHPAINGGLADDNPLPPQSAALISMITAVKAVTGAYGAVSRIYLPGIPGSGQISGFLEVFFQLTLQNWIDALFAEYVLDATAYQLHSVSYTPNSKPRTVRQINPITSYRVDNVVRSQRKREPGVGI